MEFTTPYTPEQNSVAECMNHTLIEIMCALLFDSQLPKIYWPYTVKAVVYLQNQIMLVKEEGKTLHKLWTSY
jgi:hypothetical protein